MLRSLLVFALVFFLSASSNAEVVERIIAIVNDDLITLSDMKIYEDQLRKGALIDETLIPDDATRQSLLKDRNLLLQKMIEEKVIDSEVKKQNLTAPIEQVEQEIRALAKRNNVSREGLKASLLQNGVEFSRYQDFVKTGIGRRNLVEKSVASRIKISEDDVLAAYVAKHGSEGDQAFEYTISHIFFQSGRSGGALGDVGKARAESALRRLREGSDFERLAAEVSEDPAFEQGGLLGVFKTGELQKDLEDILKKMEPGEFSGVLPTSGGFHIVKINKKRLIPNPRTEQVRATIRARLYDDAFKRQFRSWLDQLRQEAFVRINQ